MSLVNAMSREFTLRTYVNEVKKHYDVVLIDCMPSLGMITINALAAADSVIIPVQARIFPAKGMTQLMKTINKVKRQINPALKVDGVLLTLVDGRTNLARQTADTLRQSYGSVLKIYWSEIPVSHQSRRDQRRRQEYLRLRQGEQGGPGLRGFFKGGAGGWRKAAG